MKYPDDFINKIICGDCLEVMKEMPKNSVDVIVTDPPYGLEFMGKEWDKLRNTWQAKKGVIIMTQHLLLREIEFVIKLDWKCNSGTPNGLLKPTEC